MTTTIYQILSLLIIVNTTMALVTIFWKPRNISSIFAWAFVLITLPGIGFFIYIFLGRGLDRETIKLFYQEIDREFSNRINEEIYYQNKEKFVNKKNTTVSSIQTYLRNTREIEVAKNNSVEIFTDGKSKFEHLFQDIQQAKHSVHVEYYAFFDDKIGNQFLNILINKAKEGIEVRVIYDPFGGKTKKSFFDPLERAGGTAIPFITSKSILRKTRLNYHLHRKLVVIDGYIGWTGGFNVGDQYIYTSKKFGFWRDTHGRIVGTAVWQLQEAFIVDWNVSTNKVHEKIINKEKYFKTINSLLEKDNDIEIQIVTDGPENSKDYLKDSFIKLITEAKQSIQIQSPYLVPDESMITALLIAVDSGVNIKIMIPDMPDHPFIYRATQYYANYLQKNGIEIYQYSKGFIHSKTMIIDGKIAIFGSTNQDIRSYSLNFEISAFCYSHKLAMKMQKIFENDIENSVMLTKEIIDNQSWWTKFKQSFSRLLSPIL
nr:cardiolipin synthase [Enterococcus faecalis]